MLGPEFWNIWTSILSLTLIIYLLPIHTQMFNHTSIGVFISCIICQLCSTIYHTFCSVSPILYNLDLAGICCMSFGSPYLYFLAYGTDGLEVYTGVLVLVTVVCLALITKDTLYSKVSTHESCIIVLFVVGNYPAAKLPAAQMAVAIVISAYILFRCMRLPERLLSEPAAGKIWHSHVFWHLSVLASQLCYISLA